MQQYTHENVRSIPHLPIYCDRYEDYRQFSPRHWHDHIEIIYVVSGRCGNATVGRSVERSIVYSSS